MLLAISPQCAERLSNLMAFMPCQRGSSAFFEFFKVAPFRWATKQGSLFGASLSCMYFLKFKRHIFFLWAPTTPLPVLSFYFLTLWRLCSVRHSYWPTNRATADVLRASPSFNLCAPFWQPLPLPSFPFRAECIASARLVVVSASPSILLGAASWPGILPLAAGLSFPT